eukprot:TRINITY_DN781779_c0_g1_i1.p1 TRINITY_DN781779_c0_g1~~TRINITY_DN781779_c0_g1_i1.p1  ORF type:complete len:191 (+),score=47.91 TRINITY_DN781779_c0_g1_i1:58-630(+)
MNVNLVQNSGIEAEMLVESISQAFPMAKGSMKSVNVSGNIPVDVFDVSCPFFGEVRKILNNSGHLSLRVEESSDQSNIIMVLSCFGFAVKASNNIDGAVVIEFDVVPSKEEETPKRMGCGSGKPCKNCSCGRAQLAPGEKIDTSKMVSACGNCSKGDAFRCGACPFRGMPAFEPGQERVMLSVVDDIDLD